MRKIFKSKRLAYFLDIPPGNKFFLVYGNRTLEETIFFEELLEIQSQNSDRLNTQFLYSRKKEAGFSSGRIDASSVNSLFETNNYSPCNKFFICGPEAMVHNVKADFSNPRFLS